MLSGQFCRRFRTPTLALTFDRTADTPGDVPMPFRGCRGSLKNDLEHAPVPVVHQNGAPVLIAAVNRHARHFNNGCRVRRGLGPLGFRRCQGKPFSGASTKGDPSEVLQKQEREVGHSQSDPSEAQVRQERDRRLEKALARF